MLAMCKTNLETDQHCERLKIQNATLKTAVS